MLDVSEERSRARQNVVFEHGYLMGKLGRKRISVIVKDNIEIPSDIEGLFYIEFDGNALCLENKTCKGDGTSWNIS